jgi:plasmid stabilization system protein ParE
VQVLYRVEAEQDVAKARRWYENQRPGLGRAFQAALRRAEGLVSRHPAACPITHGVYRRLVMRQFPYAVYYQPLDDDRLEIIAVLHQRQDEDVLGERE